MTDQNFDNYIISKPTKDIKNTFSSWFGGISAMEIIIFAIVFVVGCAGIALLICCLRPVNEIAFIVCIIVWIILFMVLGVVLISTDAASGIKRWRKFINLFRAWSGKNKKINKAELTSIINVSNISDRGIVTLKNNKMVKFYKLEGINIDLLSSDESNRLVAIAKSSFLHNEINAKWFIVDQPFDINVHNKYLKNLIENSKDELQIKQLKAYLDQNNYVAETEFSKSIYIAISGKDEREINLKERLTISSLESVNISNKEVKNPSEIIYLLNKVFGGLCFSDKIEGGINPEGFADIKIEKNQMIINGNEYLSILEIKQFPNFVQSGWMKQLANCLNGKNGAQVVTTLYPAKTNIVVQDFSRAKFRIKANWDYIRNEGEQVNAAEYLDAYSNLISELAQGNKVPWKMHTYIILRASSREEMVEMRKTAIKSLKNNKFKINFLDYFQKEAYSNIFNFTYNEKLQTISIATNDVLASAFPFWSNALNDEKGLCLGYDYYSATPFFMDFKFKDNEKRNSNVFTICGQVGGGKSYCTKHIINWLRNTGCKQFIIAPTDDYDNFKTNYDKVKVINVVNKKDGLINPLQIFDANKSIQMHVNEFIGWLSLISSTDINETDERIMVEILIKLYDKFHIKDGDNFISIKNDKWPTGDDLYKLAEKELNIKDIRQKLILDKFWQISKDGKFGHLWNGHTSIDVSKDNIVIFQTKDVSADNAKDKVIMNGIMYLLFNFIKSQLQKNLESNRHIHDVSKYSWMSVIVDEAHRLINKKNPIALNALIAMAKEIRHYQGILINVTQSISDFKKGGGDDIIKQSLYHIIFHQSAADIADYEEMLKEVGGLTDQGKEFVSMARRGEALITIGNYYRAFVAITANDVNSAVWEAKKIGYNN